MPDSFDRRIVSDGALALVRAFQQRAPCHLTGGAALGGIYLGHRLSQDVDLECHDAESVRTLVRELPTIATECSARITLVRDAGTFVRATARVGEEKLEVDVILETTADIEAPPPPIEGIVVQSLSDLRASKIVCLLERSEPRDLVDLLFLERLGHSVISDLPLALRKDAGIDPGVLAWLLDGFPVSPLPTMLVPLTESELEAYRDDLARRLREAARPDRDPLGEE